MTEKQEGSVVAEVHVKDGQQRIPDPLWEMAVPSAAKNDLASRRNGGASGAEVKQPVPDSVTSTAAFSATARSGLRWSASCSAARVARWPRRLKPFTAHIDEPDGRCASCDPAFSPQRQTMVQAIQAPFAPSLTMTGWSACSAPRTASKVCVMLVTCTRHGETYADTVPGALPGDFLGRAGTAWPTLCLAMVQWHSRFVGQFLATFQLYEAAIHISSGPAVPLGMELCWAVGWQGQFVWLPDVLLVVVNRYCCCLNVVLTVWTLVGL